MFSSTSCSGTHTLSVWETSFKPIQNIREELVFNPPEFLIMSNCRIGEHSRNFQEFEKLRMGFSAIGKGNQIHGFIW
jgi:hypothetical protein